MHLCKRTRTVLGIVLITVMLLAMACAKPFRILKTNYTSAHRDAQVRELILGDQSVAVQQFTPQFNRVERVTVYLHAYNATEGDTVTFSLTDRKGNELYSETRTVGAVDGDLALTFETKCYVTAYERLTYSIGVSSENLGLITVKAADKTENGIAENGKLSFEESEYEDLSLVADYTYRTHLGMKRTLAWDAGVFMITILAGIALWFWARPVRNHKALRIVLTALTAAGALAAVYFASIRTTYSSDALDRIVYALGIITLAAYLIFLIQRIGPKPEPKDFRSAVMWQNYLQSVFFGISLYYCCMYVNAAKSMDQYLAMARIFLFFGISLVMLFEKKDYLNIPNAVWLIAGGVLAGYFYMTRSGLPGTEEEQRTLSLLIAGAIFFMGLVVIYVIRHMSKKALKNFYIPGIVIWLLFAVLTYANRGTRFWTLYSSLAFTIFALYLAVTGDTKRVLKNVSNGITVSFLIIWTFSMARSPYNKWGLSRYPMWFHTVTAGAAHTTLCAANAWGRVLWDVREQPKGSILKASPAHLILASITTDYLILAISRTGLLSLIMATAVIAVVYLIADFRKIWRYLRTCLAWMACIVALLPMVFSMTRILPTILSEPILFPNISYADVWYMVQAGEEPDSDYYMSAEMFLKYLGIRFVAGTTDSGVDDIENVDILTAIFGEKNAESTDEKQTAQSGETSASEESSATSEEPDAAEAADLSNGRFAIWKASIRELNLTGHESMQIVMPNGEVLYHTHNCYIQILYEYGIPIGLVFLLMCLFTFLSSARSYIGAIRGKTDGLTMTALPIVASFGVTAMVEWAAVPFVSISFVFLVLTIVYTQKDMMEENTDNTVKEAPVQTGTRNDE